MCQEDQRLSDSGVSLRSPRVPALPRSPLQHRWLSLLNFWQNPLIHHPVQKCLLPGESFGRKNYFSKAKRSHIPVFIHISQHFANNQLKPTWGRRIPPEMWPGTHNSEELSSEKRSLLARAVQTRMQGFWGPGPGHTTRECKEGPASFGNVPGMALAPSPNPGSRKT